MSGAAYRRLLAEQPIAELRRKEVGRCHSSSKQIIAGTAHMAMSGRLARSLVMLPLARHWSLPRRGFRSNGSSGDAPPSLRYGWIATLRCALQSRERARRAGSRKSFRSPGPRIAPEGCPTPGRKSEEPATSCALTGCSMGGLRCATCRRYIELTAEPQLFVWSPGTPCGSAAAPSPWTHGSPSIWTP